VTGPRKAASGVMGSPVIRLGRRTTSQHPAQSLPLITLLTDFGLDDPFVGVMKGVIYSRLPRARLVDLCHGIAAQSVAEGAYWLDRCQPWFPPGTLHVAVVDPGVGTARAILAAHIAGHYFLVPDNGLLSQRLLERPGADIRAVELERFGLKPTSATFHGRDVFAPLCTLLASGARAFGELGERVEPQRSALPEPSADSAGIEGEVVTVDRFGNLISNIDAGLVSAHGASRVAIGEHVLALQRTYSDVESKGLLALINAFDSVEIAEREGNAARRLGLGRGARVRVY
jgi:S-adenosyl-L-methionine hydrolase (adenosine-forming)